MEMKKLPLKGLKVDPSRNIRRSSEADDELVASVKAQGVIEPVLVDARDFSLVVGYRRYDAAVKAGLAEIPAVLSEWTPEEVLELQIVENLQRANLDPIEEARAVGRYLELTKVTQTFAGKKLGKSQAWVANRLRMLELPVAVQEQVADGALSPKHAERILTVRTPALQEEAARRAVQFHQSVASMDEELKPLRAAEDYLAKAKVKACPKCQTEVPVDADALTESYNLAQLRPKSELECDACGAKWNMTTGKVTFGGFADEPEEEAADPEKAAQAREVALEAKRKERDAQKAAQAESPVFRSQYGPLTWAATWIDGLEDEDVLRVDFLQGETNMDPNRVVVYVRPKGKLIPFTARVRRNDYSTGHVAQVFVDPDSVGAERLWGYNPDKAEIHRNRTATANWAGDRIKAKGSRTREGKPLKTTALDGSLDEVIGAVQKVDDLELLEALRDAEVAGKNRAGAMEAIDRKIASVGDWVLG